MMIQLMKRGRMRADRFVADDLVARVWNAE